MPRRFEIRKDLVLDATPEQVWDAVATGPGITSWFMPHEVEPGEGGTIRLAVEGFTVDSTITAWEPPHRLAVRGPTAPDGTFMAFEYLVEGRDGGSAVLRFVHSGEVGDGWGDEYEDQTTAGWDMYLHTLGEYLRRFRGRPVTYVTAQAPPRSAGAAGWAVLAAALGLGDDVRDGDAVHLTPDGLPPIDGVADWVRRGPVANFLGIVTEDAMYRFHGRPDAVAVGHHIFVPGIDPKDAQRTWQRWLDRVYEGG